MPWYVAGPLIGLMVPILLLIGNRPFGMSSNLRHTCAVILPAKPAFLCYDWRNVGLWNLILVLGLVAGSFTGWVLFQNPEPMVIAAATQADLQELGIRDFSELAPGELFYWGGLFSWPGFWLVIGGGFLIGFGSTYAGGCTSGHGITGLADRQLPSLIAVLSFFAGGLLATHFLLPLILKG